MGWKKFRLFLLLFLAAASLLYYGVCVSYAWIGVSWLWLWPLLACFLLLRALILFLEIRGRIKVPRWLGIVYRAVLALGLVSFLAVEGMILSAMLIEPPHDLDYIIILGAAVRGEEPTSPLLLRMDRARTYLEENPRTIAIASGGQGVNEAISEAECIRRELVKGGIDASRILMEDSSFDTVENIRNSYALIPEGSSAGIVTSSFHLCRALIIAKAQGHGDAAGVPAKTLLPLGIHYTVREFFGVVKLVLLQLFRLPALL